MAKDNLAEPPEEKWDPLFNSTTRVRGALKVAGGSPKMVDNKMNNIKSIFGLPTLAVDIAG